MDRRVAFVLLVCLLRSIFANPCPGAESIPRGGAGNDRNEGIGQAGRATGLLLTKISCVTLHLTVSTFATGQVYVVDTECNLQSITVHVDAGTPQVFIAQNCVSCLMDLTACFA